MAMGGEVRRVMGESTLGLPVRDEPPHRRVRAATQRVGQIDEIGVIGALALTFMHIMAKMRRLFWPSDNMPILAVCRRPVTP